MSGTKWREIAKERERTAEKEYLYLRSLIEAEELAFWSYTGVCFSGSISSFSRTGMKSLNLCMWTIIIGYKNNILASLGGRRNQELPEGKTSLIYFLFLFFSSSFLKKLLFLLCVLLLPTLMLESIFAVYINWYSGWPTVLGASSRSRLPQFATVFYACVSMGTHIRGVGVRVLGALGNSPHACRSWCLLTKQHRTEKAREVFLRTSKTQLVEACLILLLLLKAGMFWFTSRPQNAPDFFFPDPPWWHQYPREGILPFPLGQGTNPGSVVTIQEYFLQGLSNQQEKLFRLFW